MKLISILILIFLAGCNGPVWADFDGATCFKHHPLFSLNRDISWDESIPCPEEKPIGSGWSNESNIENVDFGWARAVMNCKNGDIIVCEYENKDCDLECPGEKKPEKDDNNLYFCRSGDCITQIKESASKNKLFNGLWAFERNVTVEEFKEAERMNPDEDLILLNPVNPVYSIILRFFKEEKPEFKFSQDKPIEIPQSMQMMHPPEGWIKPALPEKVDCGNCFPVFNDKSLKVGEACGSHATPECERTNQIIDYLKAQEKP